MKKLKFLLLFIASLSFFLCYLFITSINPYTLNNKLLILFYSFIFILLFSSSLFIRSNILSSLTRNLIYQKELLALIRQSLILSFVIILILVLSSITSIGAIDILLIIVSAFIFELFFHVKMPVRN